MKQFRECAICMTTVRASKFPSQQSHPSLCDTMRHYHCDAKGKKIYSFYQQHTDMYVEIIYILGLLHYQQRKDQVS